MAGPAGGASAGGNYGGNVNASQTYGGKEYRDQSYATKESVDRADARAKQREVKAKQRIAEKKAEEIRTKDLGTTGPLKTNYKLSYFQNLRNKSIQKALDRNKVLAMRKMNLMEKGLPGLYGTLISGLTGKVPDWAKDLTQDDLLQIATSGPYLSQQKTIADVNRFAGGKDLLARVTEGQSILDTGNFPQSEYERLFPRHIPPSGQDGGNEYLPYIPVDDGEGDGEGDGDNNEFDYRFGTGQKVGADVTRGSYIFNQGGRVPRASGGIMDIATGRKGFFLGGIGDAIGDAFGGVAKAAGKVLKSDFGKMAMLAGGAYMLGGAKFMGGEGIFKAGQGLSRFSNLAKTALLKNRDLGFTKDNFSLMKMLGLSAALPFIPGINKAPPNEDIGMTERGGRLIDPLTGEEGTPASMRANIENAKIEAAGDPVKLAALNAKYNNMLFSNLPYENYGTYAEGGRIGFAGGSGFGPEGWSGIERAKRVWNSMTDDIQQKYPGGFHDFFMGGEWIDINMAKGGRVPAQEGGLMDLGGMEKDYRNEGGFVPIGREEKADDVPARLSVNEFVFTADAVRNAGGGDIDKGAEVMENMMKNLENGGRVSEESQGKGNTGAQEMFSVSERIGEVI